MAGVSPGCCRSSGSAPVAAVAKVTESVASGCVASDSDSAAGWVASHSDSAAGPGWTALDFGLCATWPSVALAD